MPAIAATRESDPNGRNPHEPGAKLDAGKTAIYQGIIDYFPRALEAVAGISQFGASKYAWKGWETVPDGYNRYRNAMHRHELAKCKGETYAEDSGLLHDAHFAWGALASLELYLREEEKKNDEG